MSDQSLSEDQKWVHELGRRNAERIHDRQDALVDQLNNAAINGGQAALRAILLVNGGAAVAMLAFISGIASVDRIAGDQIREMAGSLVWFAWGVTGAVTGMALAYLTNYFASEQISSWNKQWEHPHLRDQATTKRWWWARVVSHVLAIIAGLASIGLFVCGMLDVEASIGVLEFTSVN